MHYHKYILDNLYNIASTSKSSSFITLKKKIQFGNITQGTRCVSIIINSFYLNNLPIHLKISFE